MIWLLLIAIIIIIFYYLVLYKPHQTWERRNVPYIKPWPIVGNMGRPVFRQTSFTENILDLYNALDEKYFGVYQFMLPTLLIKDIELIKQICVKEFDSFLDHRTFISEEIDPLFGNNLFAMRGQKWRHMRSTLSPAFTGSKMRSMFNLISEIGEQFADYFAKNADPTKPTTMEMKDMFTRFANDVIATCAFGLKCDSLKEKKNEFYLMGKDASNFTGIRALKFFGYSVSPFLMDLFAIKLFDEETNNFFRRIVSSTMKTRDEQGIIRPDMIHLLMQAKKGQLMHEDSSKTKELDDTGFATVEESQVGKQVVKQDWSDDELAAQALVFFLAGFDSISTMMCHMANELALNPDIQEKLQAEIDVTLEENNNKINYETIMKMKYLDMVVSETLRKWPAGVALDRICTKSVTIQPTEPNESPLAINKGDIIMIPVYGIHRDPNFYPDPEKFDPERFSDENKDQIKPNTYIPFGVGPRNCIGSRFALLELKTVFVHMLSKFDFVVDKKTQIPLKLSRSNFNLVAENGFWLGLKLRNTQ